MKKSILAGRMQNAIDEISEAFQIDWPSKIKGKNTDHKRLAKLERLARESKSGRLMTAEMFLDKISEIDGIGEATVQKIENHFFSESKSELE